MRYGVRAFDTVYDVSQSDAATAPVDPNALDRETMVVAAVVIIGAIMSILDTTIVNVAIDRLAIDFNASLTTIQWVVTGYTLSLAAVIPASGWAADRFGTKRIYLASLALFMLGSALCSIAWSADSLIGFRVLQGIGGGMIMPISQMIMAEVAGPKRMGRVMGVVVMPAMLAPILGPVVGGLILQNLHWSWIFFVNVPIGIVAGILGWRMLPESNLGKAGKLDWLGLALLATSMPLIVYGLSEIATKESFSAPTVVWPIATPSTRTTQVGAAHSSDEVDHMSAGDAVVT